MLTNVPYYGSGSMLNTLYILPHQFSHPKEGLSSLHSVDAEAEV